MVRGQSVFIGAMVCLVNVFVVAAMLPGRSGDGDKPRNAQDEETPRDDEAGGNADELPTIEFRKFTGDGEDRLAEFRFVNRSSKPILVFGPGGNPLESARYRSKDEWYCRQRGICGVGLAWGRIAPGESVVVRTRVAFDGSELLFPVDQDSDYRPPPFKSIGPIDAIRIGVSYRINKSDKGVEVWSEPLKL